MTEEAAAPQDVPQDALQDVPQDATPESAPVVAEQSLFASAVLDAESVSAKSEEDAQAEKDMKEAEVEKETKDAQPEGEHSSEPSIDEIANHIVAQMLKSNNGKDE